MDFKKLKKRILKKVFIFSVIFIFIGGGLFFKFYYQSNSENRKDNLMDNRFSSIPQKFFNPQYWYKQPLAEELSKTIFFNKSDIYLNKETFKKISTIFFEKYLLKFIDDYHLNFFYRTTPKKISTKIELIFTIFDNKKEIQRKVDLFYNFSLNNKLKINF